MILYDGLCDQGVNRTLQEDAVYAEEIAPNIYLFIVGDGCGSYANGMNPAEIAVTEIANAIKRQLIKDQQYLIDNAEYILEEAINTTNRILGIFHVVNEEKYAGFGCSITACLIYNNRFTFAHAGNTRLYLIKTNKNDQLNITPVTIDHTEGYNDYINGKISADEYHTSPSSLQLTSGLGIFSTPTIQTMSGKFKEKTIMILSTDGIHYHINEPAIMSIVLKSENTKDAANALIEASKSLETEDNMSVIVIYNT